MAKGFGLGRPGFHIPQHPQAVRGYEQKLCHICGKKALYRCGWLGYCKDHKQESIKDRQKRFNRFEARAGQTEKDIASYEQYERSSTNLKAVKARRRSDGF